MVPLTFILACPTKWRNIIVQLGKRRPMECLTPVGDGKVCRYLVRLDRRKPFNPGFLEWVCGNWFVELSITCICAIDRLERDEFERIRGQVRCVFLFFSAGLLTMLKFIGGTLEESSHAPRPCKSKLKLVHDLSSGVRPNCPSSKDDVANGINSWVWAARINVFSMISALLLNEQFCNFAADRQSGSKLFGAQDNSACRGR